MVLHLDFETYSEQDITKVGAHRYCDDPSFRILVAAWAIDDGDVHTWRDGEPLPENLFEALRDESVRVSAHNAEFEWCVLYYSDWPTIDIERLQCTAAICATLALPRSLAGAAETLGLSEQKDKIGKTLINWFCKPQRDGSRLLPDDPRAFTLLGEKTKVTDAWRMFVEYCAQDVWTERAIHRALQEYHLGVFSERVYHMTLRINARGIPVDLENARIAREAIEKIGAGNAMHCQMITGGISPTQTAKVKEWLAEQGHPFQSLNKVDIKAFLERKGIPDYVRQVLQLRMSGAKASTKKLLPIEAMAHGDSRVRGCFLYHAATTGRAAGRHFQPHNMVKATVDARVAWKCFVSGMSYEDLQILYDDPMDMYSAIMRALIASPDQSLNVCDYSSIEARVLCWLADQTDAVERYRKGADEYINMASRVFKIPTDRVTKQQRFIGKSLVLGCGYGMSGAKFQITMEKNGVKVSEEDAVRYVKGYRKAYAQVVRFWYACDEAAKRVVEIGNQIRIGKVIFSRKDVVGKPYLFVYLPSGRKLAYPDAQIEGGQITFHGRLGQTQKWGRCSTYGGKLVENITQGVAADIMMFGLLVAESRGHYVIGTVHDEGIAEGSPEQYADFAHSLTTLPRWANGIPIAAEGYSEKRYRK